VVANRNRDVVVADSAGGSSAIQAEQARADDRFTRGYRGRELHPFGEVLGLVGLFRTQVIRAHHSSEGAGEALAWCNAKGYGDVVNGLDIIFNFDDCVEAITGLDSVWNSDADDSGGNEREEGRSGSEGSCEAHIEVVGFG